VFRLTGNPENGFMVTTGMIGLSAIQVALLLAAGFVVAFIARPLTQRWQAPTRIAFNSNPTFIPTLR
jgi:hypothetical protein